ncbi:hypothetical protein SACS_0916 [Parasaccharibacter apium]|uniref:Uncharacterized protein n=1 Tax=Parasaccharibacter apium TaxID=1510841 RepID=A0A7U7G5N4_9PROT|nr:hypothetical protein SACS_0916 [Parasaccharibacter apium]
MACSLFVIGSDSAPPAAENRRNRGVLYCFSPAPSIKKQDLWREGGMEEGCLLPIL